MENCSAHNEQVAEIAHAPVQVRLRRPGILRVLFQQDVPDKGQVLPVVEGGLGVMLPHREMHVLPLGEDHVVPADQLPEPPVAQPVQDLRSGGPLQPVGEPGLRFRVEVAPVVEKAVKIRLRVLPGPVLRRQLAVGAVFGGEVVRSHVVLQKAGEALLRQSGPHLDGDEKRVLRHKAGLVTAHKQLDLCQKSTLFPVR